MSLNTKLKLLAGEPFEVEGVGLIYPPTIKDIIRVGYDRYMFFVGLFTIDAKEALSIDDNIDINGFDVIALSKDKQLKDGVVEATKFFFKEDIVRYSINFHRIEIGEMNVPGQPNRIIDRNNYNNIREVIDLISLVKPVDCDGREYKAKNDKAKEIIEKLQRSKKKIKEQKMRRRGNGEEEMMDISDIISAVSAKSSAPVLDLTMYQLIDRYKRLERISQYDFGLMAMLQVGSDKVKLKHWATRMSDEDD